MKRFEASQPGASCISRAARRGQENHGSVPQPLTTTTVSNRVQGHAHPESAAPCMWRVLLCPFLCVLAGASTTGLWSEVGAGGRSPQRGLKGRGRCQQLHPSRAGPGGRTPEKRGSDTPAACDGLVLSLCPPGREVGPASGAGTGRGADSPLERRLETKHTRAPHQQGHGRTLGHVWRARWFPICPFKNAVS